MPKLFCAGINKNEIKKRGGHFWDRLFFVYRLFILKYPSEAKQSLFLFAQFFFQSITPKVHGNNSSLAID